MPKKSLLVTKKVYGKVDEVFHRLFFDQQVYFGSSGIELIINERIQSSKSTQISSKHLDLFDQVMLATFHPEYQHTLEIKGRYTKIRIDNKPTRRSPAFKVIYDNIVWDQNLPLLEDYTRTIQLGLTKRQYTASKMDNTLHVTAAHSVDEIKGAIQAYIDREGGYLTQTQFIALTGASISDLQNLFGKKHNIISNKEYPVDDVLKYSSKYTYIFERKVVRRAQFPETHYNTNANIMNLFRKALDLTRKNNTRSEALETIVL